MHPHSSSDARPRAALALNRLSGVLALVGGLIGMSGLALLSGCASPGTERAIALIREGRDLEGLAALERAAQEHPRDAAVRSQLLSQRWQLSTERIRKADRLIEEGRLQEAAAPLKEALQISPYDERARALQQQHERLMSVQPELQRLLKAVEATRADASRLEEAQAALSVIKSRAGPSTTVERLERQLDALRASELAERQRKAEAASPLLRPVSLQVREASVRSTMEAVSRSAGVNIVFDKDVKRDLRVTLSVQDVPLADLIDLILLQSQLARRTVNANSLFIYPATESRLRELQELDVRSFHVAYGDVKQVATAVRTLLKLREVVIDERGSSIVLREPPAVLAVAERIIRAHDRAEPEVMLELDVLEVSRDLLRNLGVRLPDSVGISVPAGAGSGGASTLADLRNLTRDQLLVTPLGAGINLRVSDTDANLLASPRIRARHRQPARVMIGDKVPVITNTVTPLQSGSSVVTGAIQYLDVGIKLQVEPEVYPDSQVGIRLNLEVSNIAREIAGPSGSLAYQIGTRNAETALRLRDGETQILAGLISDQVRSTAARVPGVGQLPMLGRLFSSTNGNDSKTEIVLSITPRIVRPVTPLPPGIEQFPSGTEQQIRPRALTLDTPAGAQAAVTVKLPSDPSPAPASGAAGAAAALPSEIPSVPVPPGANPQAAAEAPAPRRSRPPQSVDVNLPPNQ